MRRQSSPLSDSERYRKALSKQGKLTAEQLTNLAADLLRLLNSKHYPKDTAQLKQELIRFCGWSPRKIYGPRPYVADCLEILEKEGLVDSQYESRGEFPESTTVGWFWKKEMVPA